MSARDHHVAGQRHREEGHGQATARHYGFGRGGGGVLDRRAGDTGDARRGMDRMSATNPIVTTSSDWQAVYRYQDRITAAALREIRAVAHKHDPEWAAGFVDALACLHLITVDEAANLKRETVQTRQQRIDADAKHEADWWADHRARALPIGSRFD